MAKKPNGGPEGADLRRRAAQARPVRRAAVATSTSAPASPATIALNIPILASAMDTVTEAADGHRHGAGRRHRRHPPQPRAGRAGRAGAAGEEVRVRHGGEPAHHPPGRDARRCARADEGSTASPAFRWSRAAATARAGKLVGILTNRDVRFATDPQPAGLRADDQGPADHGARGRRARTRPSACCTSTASRSCWWSTTHYRCVGLITVKDIEKAVANPNACKDEQGRLRVAAATTVGDKGFERTERLIDAGVDLVVVDTAHGHSAQVLDARRAHQAALERGAGRRRQRRDRAKAPRR